MKIQSNLSQYGKPQTLKDLISLCIKSELTRIAIDLESYKIHLVTSVSRIKEDSLIIKTHDIWN